MAHRHLADEPAAARDTREKVTLSRQRTSTNALGGDLRPAIDYAA
jgi:hypothetical protein